MQLGELIEKMTTSDRLVIINAAGQVIYRGYKESMADARIAGNGSCCPITAPEMVAENGSR